MLATCLCHSITEMCGTLFLWSCVSLSGRYAGCPQIIIHASQSPPPKSLCGTTPLRPRNVDQFLENRLPITSQVVLTTLGTARTTKLRLAELRLARVLETQPKFSEPKEWFLEPKFSERQTQVLRTQGMVLRSHREVLRSIATKF